MQREPAGAALLGHPRPGGETGDVILIAFTLNGQNYQALNGGAPADYGTAASIAVACPDQAEVDRLWAAPTANGGSEIACGWLRDRWGVPWQIFPEALPRLLADPDPAFAGRVFRAMQGMVKLDLAALERAAVGGLWGDEAGGWGARDCTARAKTGSRL